MSAEYEKDPVMLLDRFRKITLQIIDEICFYMIENIKKSIEEIKKEKEALKWNFPIDCKKAKDDANGNTEAYTTLINNLKKTISEKNTNLIRKKNSLDNTQMTFLYIKQGIQVAFNGVMLVYGVAAAKTPSIALKGSGDIVMKAAQSNKVYITGDQEVATPTPAVLTWMDTAEFVVKAASAGNNCYKEIDELVKEKKELDIKYKDKKKEG